jgi:hypothetical protein
MASQRRRLSQPRPRHGGNGRVSNGDTSRDQLPYIEQVLEILGCQTAELQRLAALAASRRSSTIKKPTKASNTAHRTRERRQRP